MASATKSKVPGCTDIGACNFFEMATEDDDSCEFCSCPKNWTSYPLTIESSPSIQNGYNTIRFYVNMLTSEDELRWFTVTTVYVLK